MKWAHLQERTYCHASKKLTSNLKVPFSITLSDYIQILKRHDLTPNLNSFCFTKIIAYVTSASCIIADVQKSSKT